MLERKRKRSAIQEAEALFNLYEQPMYRIAFAILHDAGQAEDAVMDAFVKILKSDRLTEGLRSDATKRMMLRAVQQTSIDRYRRNRKERATITPSQNAIEAASSTVVDESDIREHARIDGLGASDMISELPENYRAVLQKRIIEDLSVAQTAQDLGISEANVRKRQQRALQMLNKQMKGAEYDQYCRAF